jgi:LCP family protein required for cell wall assembly
MSGYDYRPWKIPDGPDGDPDWRPRSRSGGRMGGQPNRRPDQQNVEQPADERSAGGHRAAAPDPRPADPRPDRPAVPADSPDRRRADRRKSGRRRGKWGWKKKTLVWTSGAMGFVLLAAGGVAGYAYLHFDANIKSTQLLPKGQTQPPEIPDKFGRTPLNILVMGSDTRDTAADCQLGHDCPGSGANAAGPPHADVEMLVHLAADRSNMTVMSIPRDTIVKLPSGCAHGETNLINAALNFGPECQVEEVRELTGLTIDGYVMADMGAVVGLSAAIGPVAVCVTNNVYDSYSGLKLPKGTSQVVGVQALQWLRSRHAFGDEVYREEAQHYFLSAMIRKLESEGSFSNIGTLYSVADAATKSLTVSQNLDSVMDLLSLAQQMGKVPTSRITMLTMPWQGYTGPNTAWRASQLQLMQPQASEMFAALRADQPYTRPDAPPAATAPGGSTASPPAAATGAPVDDASVKVSVVNDSGTSGRALTIRDALVSGGFSQATDVSGNGTGQTAVYYPAGRSDSAAAVANALGVPAGQVKQSGSYSQVTVLVGRDWQSGTTYSAAAGAGAGAGAGTGVGPGSGPSTTPADQASAPPDDSYVNLVSDANSCMTVPTPEWH